jgi:L-amino acid N-acyltransferase YncA
MIRAAQPSDAQSLANLYNHYVIHSVTTFETDPIDAVEMAARVADVQATGLPWLVLVQQDEILGYACAVRWKGRAAYQHSVETTVYLAADCGGGGKGTELYTSLLAALRQQAVHCVIAGIAQPNEASVALHEKLGFNKVAHFPEVGRKFDRWIDVAYWQRLLN